MKECIVCGKEYVGHNKFCCTRACWSIARAHFRKCVICGKTFRAHPSDDTVTCSAECCRINRTKKTAIYGLSALEKAHAAASVDPRLIQSAEHINAKTWVIRAPNGQTYECRNLLHWLREHADMIDGTVNQAWDGLAKIKYSMQGKRKNPSRSWKGWTLFDWGD